jgi:hypothetical protein
MPDVGDAQPGEGVLTAPTLGVAQMSRAPGDRSTTTPGGDNASRNAAIAEMARETVIDLRAELPRIDARAAAGAALTAAVLVSVVNQGPISSPVYALRVGAAVLLTIALLLFLAALFPSMTVAGHLAAAHAERTEQRARATKQRPSPQAQASNLVARLANTDPVQFYAEKAVRLHDHIRTKQVFLALAFVAGLLAIAALASGASLALLLGWR